MQQALELVQAQTGGTCAVLAPTAPEALPADAAPLRMTREMAREMRGAKRRQQRLMPWLKKVLLLRMWNEHLMTAWFSGLTAPKVFDDLVFSSLRRA